MCPTCGVTIQKVNDGIPRVWWCPRCGTIKSEGGVPEHEAPRFLAAVLRNLEHYEDTGHREEPGPLCGVLWGKVAHLFGLGSTTATAMCRSLGFDPHKKAD